jgi:hypothetical protein
MQGRPLHCSVYSLTVNYRNSTFPFHLNALFVSTSVQMVCSKPLNATIHDCHITSAIITSLNTSKITHFSFGFFLK